MSKVKITCFHFWSDWTDMTPREIDLDEWNWFELQYRCDLWYIIGSKYNQKQDKWYEQELADHGVVSKYELAKFVKAAGAKINKISTNNFNTDLVKKTAELYEALKSL